MQTLLASKGYKTGVDSKSRSMKAHYLIAIVMVVVVGIIVACSVVFTVTVAFAHTRRLDTVVSFEERIREFRQLLCEKLSVRGTRTIHGSRELCN